MRYRKKNITNLLPGSLLVILILMIVTIVNLPKSCQSDINKNPLSNQSLIIQNEAVPSTGIQLQINQIKSVLQDDVKILAVNTIPFLENKNVRIKISLSLNILQTFNRLPVHIARICLPANTNDDLPVLS
jgi:hypothetical protein